MQCVRVNQFKLMIFFLNSKRCIGKMNKKLGNKLFQCVHVAAVQESDYVAHGHLVNATNVYLKKTY